MEGQWDDHLPPPKRSKPTLDHANDVLRFRRERPPADYLLRIESFSELETSLQVGEKDAFESTEFVAQGFTWVLRIYPTGNKDDDGEDHLSLYLEMVRAHDESALVTCTFKLLVYDHKHDNYLAVQNIHEKSFHALKNEWGISRVLKLTTFTDESQGFLKNDCCIFGVEISVIHFGITRTAANLSLKDIGSRSSYTWKIDNFSKLDSNMLSPVFIIGGHSWKLLIYPKGEECQQGENLSLFLQLSDVVELACGEKMWVEFELSLKNQHTNSTDYKKTVIGVWSHPSAPGWGYSDFIPVDSLQSRSSSFIRDDSLIVEVNIISMFVLSDLKPLSGR